LKGKRVAVCCYTVPRFDRDSGSRRLLDLIRFLQHAGCSVTFISAHELDGRHSRYMRHLQQIGVPVFQLPADPVEELILESRFDVAILTFWPVAELVGPLFRKLSPATRIVVDSVDLHFLRDARRFMETTGPELAPFDSDYGVQVVGELNAYANADLVLTVSHKEKQVLGDFLGEETPIRAVPDCEELEPSAIPMKDRRGILFIGSFYHTPNIPAAEFLCREILPRIDSKLLERHPVYLVGDGLNDTVRSIAEGKRHVNLVGWVPSVEPYLQQARVSILPLLYGAGTKRKLIQALMTGTPTVSTSFGTEGLSVIPGEDLLVADDADGLAAAVSRLLVDDQECERLASNGRTAVLETHSRAIAERAFVAAMQDALPLEPKRRKAASEDPMLFGQRMVYQETQRLRDALCEALTDLVSPGATVAVASGGSTELLRLGAFKPLPYLTRDGQGPAMTEDDLDDARRELDELISQGAELLLVPAPSMRWLEARPLLRQHLDAAYRIVLRDDEIGIAYALTPKPVAVPARLDAVAPTPRIGLVERRASDANGGQPTDDGRADGGGERVAGARLISFYLPQFHPIPENDRWWGEGFTEWTNVVKAEPLFPGHYQPHMPADFGFYDLRLPEVRAAQAEMAEAYGIHGFCYYHYWFHGKQLLEKPFDEVLKSGDPAFPFCLAWANEPWSRRWDGRPHDVLQHQSYSTADDVEHIRHLLPAFADERAITVDGKPVFIVYQGRDLPDPARTVDIWREEVDGAGLPGLYLMTVETGWDASWDATQVGFDAKILFNPQFSILDQVPTLFVGPETMRVYDYETAWRALLDAPRPGYKHYETVCARWDNSPRQGGNGVVLHRSTPEGYGEWLANAISRVLPAPEDERLVFLNAWNEWAEGAHLEPDQLYGRGYLEATRRALHGAGGTAPHGPGSETEAAADVGSLRVPSSPDGM
jgi:glycosyltransferase involved in cell wall biosynthesis